MRISGKRVLLSGASGGLGQAIARELHARGAHLQLSARRVEVLDQLCSELGDRAQAIEADLASREDVTALPEKAGRVDVLVANAGLPGTGGLDEYSVEEIDRVLEVNLRSAILLCHALVPGMVERGEGQVVLMSSLSGKAPSAGAALYCATKFGLRGFGLSLRDDLNGTGVGVTVICPGFIGEAGMFGDTGLKPPSGVGTRSPTDVAQAVVRAIERNPPEIDVAPRALSAGVSVALVAPRLGSWVRRRSGGTEFAARLAEAQKPKR